MFVIATLLVHIFCICIKWSASGNVCPEGECQQQTDCPQNALCVSGGNSACGLCLCKFGYVKQGTTCSPQVNSAPQQSAQQSSAVQPPPKSKSVLVEDTGSNIASAQATPETLSCSSYDCEVQIINENDNDPMKVRIQKFQTPDGCKKTLARPTITCQGMSTCYGSYCLSDSSTSSTYCVCPFDKVGPECIEAKPGKCSAAVGKTSKTVVQENKRFRYKNDKSRAYSRHVVTSLEDCIKLCQWPQSVPNSVNCQSVNYGKMDTYNVCELLSNKVDSPILKTWVVDAPGWQYVCCM